jgi:hypothetical protein
LAQGDKDSKSAVICAGGMLAVWPHRTFRGDPAHVGFVNQTPEELRRFVYLERLRHLPFRFQIYNEKAWASFEVYDHITFKEKCFDLVTGSRKAGRRTHGTSASGASAPTAGARPGSPSSSQLGAWRRWARRTARTTQPKSPGPSRTSRSGLVTTWSQPSRALTEMEIVEEGVSVCIECHGDKPPLSAAHGDSTAMFDEVQEPAVSEEFDAMEVRIPHTSRHTAVTVMRDAHHRAFLSGRHQRRWDPSPDFGKNAWADIITFLEIRKHLIYSAATNRSRISRYAFLRLLGG